MNIIFFQQGHKTIVWKPIIKSSPHLLIPQLFIDLHVCARHCANYIENKEDPIIAYTFSSTKLEIRAK
jgi:hypothetical protein